MANQVEERLANQASPKGPKIQIIIIRNLRATLDQVDLDNRGAKPSKHTR